MTCCPTCGRKCYTPAPPRVRICWACGESFVQQSGRPRIVCHDPACEAKRKAYRKRGGATLESEIGCSESPLRVPPRVLQHALGRSR